MKPIKITESSQLVFPCWLKFHTGAWLRFKREPAPQWLEVNCTHWHPDQPTAPSEVPGETHPKISFPCQCGNPNKKGTHYNIDQNRPCETAPSPDPATEAARDAIDSAMFEAGLMSWQRDKVWSAIRTVQEPLEREMRRQRDLEWFQHVESGIGRHPVSSLEAVRSMQELRAKLVEARTQLSTLAAELEASHAIPALTQLINMPWDHADGPTPRMARHALTSLTALREKLKTP